MRYLITGGAGFIGSNVVNYFQAAGHDVDVLDSLTYASDVDRLDASSHVYTYDFTQPLRLRKQYDWIVHIGAETHVDRSIDDPMLFARTNVLGTVNMLEFARTQTDLDAFLYFSTDEVFGPAPGDTVYREWDRYNSGNPYAASKAGGEEMVLAYGNTYGLPVRITHTMNVYGPTQHDEKFIPSTVRKVLAGETVIIHSNAERTKAGSRFYIHASDIASAVDFVLTHGQNQDKFNVVGLEEVTNLDVAWTIAGVLGLPLNYEMVDFHSSRPGHDLRYGLDGTKLAEMGWTPKVSFQDGIASTVAHYAEKYEA